MLEFLGPAYLGRYFKVSNWNFILKVRKFRLFLTLFLYKHNSSLNRCYVTCKRGRYLQGNLQPPLVLTTHRTGILLHGVMCLPVQRQRRLKLPKLNLSQYFYIRKSNSGFGNSHLNWRAQELHHVTTVASEGSTTEYIIEQTCHVAYDDTDQFNLAAAITNDVMLMKAKVDNTV